MRPKEKQSKDNKIRNPNRKTGMFHKGTKLKSAYPG